MVINWLKQICELILVSGLSVEALKPISVENNGFVV